MNTARVAPFLNFRSLFFFGLKSLSLTAKFTQPTRLPFGVDTIGDWPDEKYRIERPFKMAAGRLGDNVTGRFGQQQSNDENDRSRRRNRSIVAQRRRSKGGKKNILSDDKQNKTRKSECCNVLP